MLPGTVSCYYWGPARKHCWTDGHKWTWLWNTSSTSRCQWLSVTQCLFWHLKPLPRTLDPHCTRHLSTQHSFRPSHVSRTIPRHRFSNSLLHHNCVSSNSVVVNTEFTPLARPPGTVGPLAGGNKASNVSCFCSDVSPLALFTCFQFIQSLWRLCRR